MDASTVVAISPVRTVVETNSFSGATVVSIEMTAADGKAVEQLFAGALKSGGDGGMRQDLILLDGKVIVNAFVAGPFAGTTLDIDPASADAAKLIAKILSGPDK